MNKKIITVTIIISILMFASCKKTDNMGNIGSNELNYAGRNADNRINQNDDKNEINENKSKSKDLNSLLSDSSNEIELTINVSNSIYKTTKTFKTEIINILKEHGEPQILDINKIDKNNFIILNFEGYEDIYFDKSNNFFFFSQTNEMYETKLGDVWDNHIIKLINNELIFTEFRYEIITETTNSQNNLNAKLLYLNNVYLKVNNSSVLYEKLEEKSLLYSNPKYFYYSIDTFKDSNLFLVTNVRKQTNYINQKMYAYINNKLEQIWSNNLSIKITNYDNTTSIITYKFDGDTNETNTQANINPLFINQINSDIINLGYYNCKIEKLDYKIKNYNSYDELILLVKINPEFGENYAYITYKINDSNIAFENIIFTNNHINIEEY